MFFSVQTGRGQSAADSFQSAEKFVDQGIYDTAFIYLYKLEAAGYDSQKLQDLRSKVGEKMDSDTLHWHTLKGLLGIIEDNAYLYNDYGSLSYKVGAYTDALRYLSRSCLRNDSLHTVNYNLAVVYYQVMENDERALFHVNKELRYYPDDVPSMSLKASLLIDTEDTGKFEEILALLTGAKAIDSLDYMLYTLSGIVKFRREDFRGALQDYSKVIELNGADPDMFVRRASTHVLLGNYDSTFADCERALEINIDYYDAYEVLFRLYDKLDDKTNRCKTLEKIRELRPGHDLEAFFEEYGCE